MSGPDLLGALADDRDPGAALPGRAGDARGRRAEARRVPGEAETTAGAPRCSRRGCTAPAVWALEWNNPRVHTPERVKTWIACPAHRAHLADFLASRGFLRRARPLTCGAAGPPDPSDSSVPSDPPGPSGLPDPPREDTA